LDDKTTALIKAYAAIATDVTDPKAVSLRAGHMLPAGATLHADGLIAENVIARPQNPHI
jgi:hypothetical protein